MLDLHAGGERRTEEAERLGGNRSLTVAASMRRPVGVKHNFGGLRGLAPWRGPGQRPRLPAPS